MACGETGSTRYLEVVVLRRGGSSPLRPTSLGKGHLDANGLEVCRVLTWEHTQPWKTSRLWTCVSKDGFSRKTTFIFNFCRFAKQNVWFVRLAGTGGGYVSSVPPKVSVELSRYFHRQEKRSALWHRTQCWNRDWSAKPVERGFDSLRCLHARVVQLAESARSGRAKCGFESLREYHPSCRNWQSRQV